MPDPVRPHTSALRRSRPRREIAPSPPEPAEPGAHCHISPAHCSTPCTTIRPEGTAIRTDDTDTTPPYEIEPAELVELLEAHLANLNTQLALNTMALAAFGLPAPSLPAPVTNEDETW